VPDNSDPVARRAFLRFLAASPILASAGFDAAWAAGLIAEGASDPASLGSRNASVIKSVKEALTVWDFDAAARERLSTAHYTFISEGSFNNETLRANVAGFAEYQVRVRHLTGIDKVDLTTKLYGVDWESPIFFCNVGRLDAFYPEGAVVVARAARTTRTLQLLGGNAGVVTNPKLLNDVNAARGEPVWFTANGNSVTAPGVIERIEGAGCPTIVWTVDDHASDTIASMAIQRARVPDQNRNADPRCAGCHAVRPVTNRILATTPMSQVGAVGAILGDNNLKTTWDDVKRVRDRVKSSKLVLKGIVTREDAELAVRHGVDGIIVSNHGAHVDASGRGSIECLPEIAAGVGRRIPILIDSGFRSGGDVFKALALGATAVGVGRAHVWALASFGQEGVETVVAILRRELQVMMAQAAAASIGAIRPDMLIKKG
jgi:4-hydroxymandelate oxidase